MTDSSSLLHDIGVTFSENGIPTNNEVGARKGDAYQNNDTGEIFRCDDQTPLDQYWIGSQGTFANEPITSESNPYLQLMYRMDTADITGSTIDDRSPKNRDGTISGAVNVAGKIAEALSFDGINDFIETNWNSTDQKGSISLWATRSSAANTPLIGMGDTITATQNLALQWHTAGEVRFIVQQSPGFGNAIVVTTNTVAVDANTFHHICITNSGANGGWKIYLNGSLEVLIPSGSGNNGSWFNSVNLGADTPTVRVARDQYTSGDFYGNAKIDQLRIFNKELTAAEVAALYNSGAGA